jgi:hypothetical protein
LTAPVPTTDPLFPSRWLGVAERVCERYYAEFPKHDAQYGGRGRAYCAHDNSYLVAWLVDALDTAGSDSFTRNVTWLRGVLTARGFPMDAFRRNLELVGDAVAELRPGDAERIRGLVVVAQATEPA